MLWGARMDGAAYGVPTQDAPWSDTTWAQFETNAGRKVDIVHFGQPPPWKQPFAAAPFQKCYDRGAEALCSIDNGGATLADIAAGKYDQQIITWALAARDYGKPILLRFLWEMNGDWYQWGKEAKANPAVYRQAWERFFAVMRVAPNVESVWCPNVNYPGSTPLGELYPESVTHIGLDGYNFGSRKGGWRSFGEVFAPTVQQVGAWGKPIIVCEVGCSEVGGSKAGWIRDLFTTLPLYDLEALVWFNWPIVENGVTWDWQIESSPASRAAFAEGVASLPPSLPPSE